ncbi:MAG: hypothetical protein V4594_00395 [Bacteroidota bacterium]
MTLAIKDEYCLTISKGKPEIQDILYHNALILPDKRPISRQITKKKLIGKFQENAFTVIGSSPIEIACVLNGSFEFINHQQTTVNIKTQLHKGFRILFIVWLVFIAAAVIIPSLLAKSMFSPLLFLPLTFGVVFFWLFLYCVYIIARNRTIRKIENLLY